MYESETEVAIPWKYDLGGFVKSGRSRAKPGSLSYGAIGNGVVRAIAIGTNQRYHDVYMELLRRQDTFVSSSRSKQIRDKGSYIPDVGVWPQVYKQYLFDQGWFWMPTMEIGSGTRVHLTYEELPDEPTLIVKVSKSLVAVLHGMAHDAVDPSRGGTRAVYGYWTPPAGA